MSFQFLKGKTVFLRSGGSSSVGNGDGNVGNMRLPDLANNNRGLLGGDSGAGTHQFKSNGPGGQILLQRQDLTQNKQHNSRKVSKSGLLQQRPQQSIVPEAKTAQQRQQQLDTQGVISMEEVMRDLRILEEQQQESQRKLQSAQTRKRQEQQRHSRLEQRLGELKFANGKCRADIQRMREALTESTKEVLATRSKVEGAESDLHKFNCDLREALLAKGRILCCQRKQENQITRIQAKLDVLIRERDGMEACRNQAEARLEKARAHEQYIRDSLEKETQEQQKLASQINQKSMAMAELERSLEAKLKAEIERKQQIRELKESEAQMETDHKQSMAQIEDGISKKRFQNGQVQCQLSKEKDLLKELQAGLEAMIRRHQDTSKENGVPVQARGKGPSTWDETAAKAMLEMEETAVKDEQEAKDNLEEEVKSLQFLVNKLSPEAEQLQKEVAGRREAVKEAQEAEDKRYAEMKDVLKQLDIVKADKKKLLEQIRNVKLVEEKEAAEENKRAQELAEQIEAMEAEILAEQKRLEELDNEMQQSEQAHIADLEKWEKEAAELRAEIARDETEIEKIKADSDHIDRELGLGDENEEDFYRAIDKLISENPVLKQVILTYEPYKTIEEQAKVDLKLVIEECDRWVEAAEKNEREETLSSISESPQQQKQREDHEEKEKITRKMAKEEEKQARNIERCRASHEAKRESSNQGREKLANEDLDRRNDPKLERATTKNYEIQTEPTDNQHDDSETEVTNSKPVPKSTDIKGDQVRMCSVGEKQARDIERRRASHEARREGRDQRREKLAKENLDKRNDPKRERATSKNYGNQTKPADSQNDDSETEVTSSNLVPKSADIKGDPVRECSVGEKQARDIERHRASHEAKRGGRDQHREKLAKEDLDKRNDPKRERATSKNYGIQTEPADKQKDDSETEVTSSKLVPKSADIKGDPVRECSVGEEANESVHISPTKPSTLGDDFVQASQDTTPERLPSSKVTSTAKKRVHWSQEGVVKTTSSGEAKRLPKPLQSALRDPPVAANHHSKESSSFSRETNDTKTGSSTKEKPQSSYYETKTGSSTKEKSRSSHADPSASKKPSTSGLSREHSNDCHRSSSKDYSRSGVANSTNVHKLEQGSSKEQMSGREGSDDGQNHSSKDRSRSEGAKNQRSSSKERSHSGDKNKERGVASGHHSSKERSRSKGDKSKERGLTNGHRSSKERSNSEGEEKKEKGSSRERQPDREHSGVGHQSSNERFRSVVDVKRNGDRARQREPSKERYHTSSKARSHTDAEKRKGDGTEKRERSKDRDRTSSTEGSRSGTGKITSCRTELELSKEDHPSKERSRNETDKSRVGQRTERDSSTKPSVGGERSSKDRTSTKTDERREKTSKEQKVSSLENQTAKARDGVSKDWVSKSTSADDKANRSGKSKGETKRQDQKANQSGKDSRRDQKKSSSEGEASNPTKRKKSSDEQTGRHDKERHVGSESKRQRTETKTDEAAGSKKRSRLTATEEAPNPTRRRRGLISKSKPCTLEELGKDSSFVLS